MGKGKELLEKGATQVNRKEEPCPCGRGNIVYEKIRGSWLSHHTVWLEGSSFGKQEYAPCCSNCEKEQYDKLVMELADDL